MLHEIYQNIHIINFIFFFYRVILNLVFQIKSHQTLLIQKEVM